MATAMITTDFNDEFTAAHSNRKKGRRSEKLGSKNLGRGTRIAITIDGATNGVLISAIKQMGVTKRDYVKEALMRRLANSSFGLDFGCEACGRTYFDQQLDSDVFICPDCRSKHNCNQSHSNTSDDS